MGSNLGRTLNSRQCEHSDLILLRRSHVSRTKGALLLQLQERLCKGMVVVESLPVGSMHPLHPPPPLLELGTCPLLELIVFRLYERIKWTSLVMESVSYDVVSVFKKSFLL